MTEGEQFEAWWSAMGRVSGLRVHVAWAAWQAARSAPAGVLAAELEPTEAMIDAALDGTTVQCWTTQMKQRAAMRESLRKALAVARERSSVAAPGEGEPLRAALVTATRALLSAKYAIKGREHTGFIDTALAEIDATLAAAPEQPTAALASGLTPPDSCKVPLLLTEAELQDIAQAHGFEADPRGCSFAMCRAIEAAVRAKFGLQP